MAIFVATVFALAFHFGPGERIGDGSEYYLLLITVAEHGTPYATDESGQLYDAWVSTQPHSETFEKYARLRDGSLRALQSPQGEVDTLHFWLYPLLAAPFYWFITLTGGDIAWSFVLLHLALLFAAAEYSRRNFGGAGIAAIALVALGSPAFWYLNKAHTEFFTVTMTAIAASCFLKERYGQSAVWFAVTSTQNPPFAILAVLCLIYGMFSQRDSDERRNLVRWAAVAGMLMAMHPIYYLWRHGVLTPTIKSGFADFQHTWPSWKILTCHLLDPDIGLVTNWVLAGPLAAGGLIVARRRRKAFDLTTASIVAASILVLAWAQARNTTNINSGGTTGVSRYGLWYIFYFFGSAVLIGQRLGELPRAAAGGISLFLGAGILFTVGQYRPSRPGSYQTPSAFAVWFYDALPNLYDPIPEVFFERRSVFKVGTDYRVASSKLRNKVLIVREELAANDPEKAIIHTDHYLDPSKVRAAADDFFAENPRDDFAYLNGRANELERLPGALKPGQFIEFTAGGRSSEYLRQGWSIPEPWGTWSEASRAVLEFRFDNPKSGDYRLTIRAVGYLPASVVRREVGVTINACALAPAIFENHRPHEISLAVPSACVRESNRLEFDVADPGPARPEDGRLLGIGLIRISLELSDESSDSTRLGQP